MAIPDPPEAPGALLGRWRLLRAHASLEFAPEAGMEFLEHGELRDTFDVAGRRQLVALRYQVRDGILSTTNPTAPHTMTVLYRIGAGDVLVFDFGGGAEACFVRDQ